MQNQNIESELHALIRVYRNMLKVDSSDPDADEQYNQALTMVIDDLEGIVNKGNDTNFILPANVTRLSAAVH